MIRGDRRELAIGKDALNFFAEGAVKFRPPAVAVHDPRPAVHEVLAKLGDRGVVEMRDGFPSGEVEDGELSGVIAELSEIRADIAIALAKLAIGELDPFF